MKLPWSADIFLRVGQRCQLLASPRDVEGNELADRVVVWTSNKPRVADVLDSGVVIGLGVGRCTITASCEGKVERVLIRVGARRPSELDDDDRR